MKANLLGVLIYLFPGLLLVTDGLMFHEDVNITAILDQLMIGYDKRVRPNYGGQAVTVGVSLYILAIHDFSEQSMDFTFDMYFRQFWHDPRLVFERRPGLEKIVQGADYVKNIWVPDTFFVNEKETKYHQAPTDNEFIRIMHTGDVLRSIRMTVKASCPLDLQYFPFDKQMCTLEIESFGFTMSDLKFRWEDGERSVQLSPDVALAEFNILGHRQRIIEASLSSGNYSRLLVDVQFDRAGGHYVIQVYLPTILIVTMSWLVFWLSPDEVSARVGLCAVSVLALTTVMVSVNKELPKISYLKCLDIYLGVCMLYLLGALMECVCVSFIAQAIQARKDKDRQLDQDRKVTRATPKILLVLDPRNIDLFSKIGFPIAFLCFNVVYWMFYRRASKQVVDDLIFLH
eukprot:TRINITY_DN18642_c0_g1_i1.p1 TRINITY_DN18642_c0_g1~~TRINITY_DN18642_c0_g1_i1.p1  ORF type:complete len:401 (+),score=73.27 TRINITY_DN18642_c0_g1_i1:56-1258(+)